VYYSFFQEPATDWNYHQLQGIDKTKTSFSFIVFADNKNSITTFDNLIRRVNGENALFAVDVGDLVYDGEMEKFRFFLNQIEALKIPLLTVIGNHELRDHGRANYYHIFGPFYYSFAVGNSYFIMLDDTDEKGLGAQQMNWLKGRLQDAQKYKYRFVFMHVPLYDPRKGPYAEGHSLKDLNSAKALNRLFDRYNVTMLFCSHIHAYYRGKWGKTPYIITGGAGAELAGDDPNHDFYHYVRVTVSNTGVRYSVVKLKGPGFGFFERLIHDIWLYIYFFFTIHLLDLIIFFAALYLVAYLLFPQLKRVKRM